MGTTTARSRGFGWAGGKREKAKEKRRGAPKMPMHARGLSQNGYGRNDDDDDDDDVVVVTVVGMQHTQQQQQQQ